MRQIFSQYLFILLLCTASSLVFSQTPELLWSKCIGGSGRDLRPNLLATADGFIIAGHGNSTDGDLGGITNNGGDDLQIIKTSVCGNIVWKKNYGGNRFEQAFGLVATTEGGFLVCANTSSTDLPNFHGGVTDALICKMDVDGNLVWMKLMGGSGLESFFNAVSLPDSSIIVVGTSSSTDGDVLGPGDLQGWIVKLDKLGNILWKKLLGSAATENFAGIVPAANGSFIICGQTNRDNITKQSDILLIKIDALGNVLWDKSYGGALDESSFRIKSIPSGGYAVVGHGSSTTLPFHHGSVDAFVMKIDEEGTLQWQKCIGGSGAELINDLYITADSKIVVAANSNSTNGDIQMANRGVMDAFSFCMDATGELLWTYSIGGSQTEQMTSIVMGADGAFLFSGNTLSNDWDVSGNHGATDFWLFKLRVPVNSQFDTISCKAFTYRGNFITKDSTWTETLTDQCGNDSATVQFKVLITGSGQVQTIPDRLVIPGEAVVLNSTASGPVQWQGQGLSCYTCLSPTAIPVNTTSYIITTGEGNCLVADTVTITVIDSDELFIPGGFTPNGDGINDVFRARGSVSEYRLSIFNRWGEKVFETKNILDGWDGTIQGKKQASGAFVYTISYKTTSGSARERKGSFVLIR